MKRTQKWRRPKRKTIPKIKKSPKIKIVSKPVGSKTSRKASRQAGRKLDRHAGKSASIKAGRKAEGKASSQWDRHVGKGLHGLLWANRRPAPNCVITSYIVSYLNCQIWHGHWRDVLPWKCLMSYEVSLPRNVGGTFLSIFNTLNYWRGLNSINRIFVGK